MLYFPSYEIEFRWLSYGGSSLIFKIGEGAWPSEFSYFSVASVSLTVGMCSSWNKTLRKNLQTVQPSSYMYLHLAIRERETEICLNARRPEEVEASHLYVPTWRSGSTLQMMTEPRSTGWTEEPVRRCLPEAEIVRSNTHHTCSFGKDIVGRIHC